MSEEEATEFWGAIAGIAKAVAPHALRFGKRLISRFARSRRSRRSKKGRRPGSRQSPGLSRLLQIMQDPRFLSLLAGNTLNRATGRTVGRTRVRRTRRASSGRREMTHITLQEFGSLISFFTKHLAGARSTVNTGLSASVANEYGAFTENYSEADEAERLMQQLYGEELVPTEEAYGYGGFESDSEYSGLESFDNCRY